MVSLGSLLRGLHTFRLETHFRMGDHFLSDQRVKYLDLIINFIVPDVCTHRCIFKTVLRELSFHLIIQWRGEPL